jgi:hypothetical protein
MWGQAHGGSAAPIGREDNLPTTAELVLKIALRLPPDPNDAHEVLDLVREFYDGFLKNTGAVADVVALCRIGVTDSSTRGRVILPNCLLSPSILNADGPAACGLLRRVFLAGAAGEWHPRRGPLENAGAASIPVIRQEARATGDCWAANRF